MGGVTKAVGSLFGGGGGSSAAPPAVPAAVGPPPLLQSPQSDDAAQTAEQRARASAGISSTIITGPEGLSQPATTTQKQLLGN